MFHNSRLLLVSVINVTPVTVIIVTQPLVNSVQATLLDNITNPNLSSVEKWNGWMSMTGGAGFSGTNGGFSSTVAGRAWNVAVSLWGSAAGRTSARSSVWKWKGCACTQHNTHNLQSCRVLSLHAASRVWYTGANYSTLVGEWVILAGRWSGTENSGRGCALNSCGLLAAAISCSIRACLAARRALSRS